MDTAKQAAKHLREVHFGGNWTCVNLKDTIAGITWQQAVKKTGAFNTIATLVYHMNYYVTAVLGVLQGQPLTAGDKYSFDHPPIASQQDWDNLVNKVFTEAEQLAALVEQLPGHRMEENLADEKYGSLYRNIQGITEHTHYHLGQITLLKKMVQDV